MNLYINILLNCEPIRINPTIRLPTCPTRKFRRVNMLKSKINSNESPMPMPIASGLRHPNSSEFVAAFASEISSLKDMNTIIPYLDNINLILKGSLLSSKVIFNVVYNPDRTFKKFKARLVGDQLRNLFDPCTYVGTVSSPTLRLLLSITAEDDLD